MPKAGNVLLATGLVAGAAYAVAEGFGPGDCGASFFSGDIGKIAAECTGLDFQQHADATVNGPEKLDERVLNTSFTMTFTDVAMTMRFPRDTQTGDLSKLDWDPGGWGSCIGVCSTRFVKDEPFEVWYTPCAKLGDDYKEVEVGVDVDPTDTESVFDLRVDTARQKIVVEAGALATCAVRIPTVDSHGNPNAIQEHEQDDSGIIVGMSAIDDGVVQTFDYMHEDLAIAAVPAFACMENLLDQQAVRDQIGYWALGAAVALDQSFASYEVEVILGNQDEAKERALEEYMDRVEYYADLDESLFENGDGDKKDMHVQFTDQTVQLASGDCSGTSLG